MLRNLFQNMYNVCKRIVTSSNFRFKAVSKLQQLCGVDKLSPLALTRCSGANVALPQVALCDLKLTFLLKNK